MRNSRTWLSVATFVLSIQTTVAYYIGETVDTDLVTGYTTTDVLRSQMPMFGISSTASTFEMEPGTRSFSFTFEDGLWTIPTLYLENSKGEVLNEAIVAFVYSKSSAGAIHAVSITKTVYSKREIRKGKGYNFRVRYEWMEEPDVNVTAGQTVMFMFVFIAGVYFSLSSCGLFEDPDDESRDGNGSTPFGSVPKAD